MPMDKFALKGFPGRRAGTGKHVDYPFNTAQTFTLDCETPTGCPASILDAVALDFRGTQFYHLRLPLALSMGAGYRGQRERIISIMHTRRPGIMPINTSS